MLIVEDEPRIAAMVAKSLGRSGLEVLVAPDGALARFLSETEPVDAVVLDLGLPDVPGLDLLVELRSRYPRRPVLVLTARDDRHTREACLDAGAADVVTKPFDLADLRDRLAELVGGGTAARKGA